MLFINIYWTKKIGSNLLSEVHSAHTLTQAKIRHCTVIQHNDVGVEGDAVNLLFKRLQIVILTVIFRNAVIARAFMF